MKCCEVILNSNEFYQWHPNKIKILVLILTPVTIVLYHSPQFLFMLLVVYAKLGGWGFLQVSLVVSFKPSVFIRQASLVLTTGHI